VGGLRQIYADVRQESRRVMLENHQDFSLLAPQLAQCKNKFHQGGEAAGSLRAYHKRLASSRIFLAPQSSRHLGGLAAIDAASLGCLLIANRAQMWSPYLVLPELDIHAPKRAVELAAELIDDSERYEALLLKQNARLDWFAWVRPLRQVAKIALNA
jgi:hypothetical protein